MKQLRFKKMGKILILFLAFALLGCTANMGNVPWHIGIKDWSPHQKANFFMKTWLSELDAYDSMNAMENKPEDLIKVLKVKREILEGLRLPVRAYSSAVAAGETPDLVAEQEIVKLLRQLQRQYVYSGLSPKAIPDVYGAFMVKTINPVTELCI